MIWSNLNKQNKTKQKDSLLFCVLLTIAYIVRTSRVPEVQSKKEMKNNTFSYCFYQRNHESNFFFRGLFWYIFFWLRFPCLVIYIFWCKQNLAIVFLPLSTDVVFDSYFVHLLKERKKERKEERKMKKTGKFKEKRKKTLVLFCLFAISR